MTGRTFRFIVLTGPPGCGKTTLVKKVTSALKEKNIPVEGFFTEEVRHERERIGFDVVLMNGRHVPLARAKDRNTTKEPFIGKYAVDVKSFESSVLCLFSSKVENFILVLDEIGKMELLSLKFKEVVTKLFNERKSFILATVPVKGDRPIPIVELVKNHPDTILLTVSRDNRNSLADEIVNLVCEATSKLNKGFHFTQTS